MFAQLDIAFEDGTVQRIATDTSWTAGAGAVVVDDLHDGEAIDARRQEDAWRLPGFTGDGWGGVCFLDFDTAKLAPHIGPAGHALSGDPARRGEHLAGW